MNLPNKIKVSKDHIDDNGEPRRDVSIYKNYLLCHPETLSIAIEGFKDIMGIDLEVIDEEEKNNGSISQSQG